MYLLLSSSSFSAVFSRIQAPSSFKASENSEKYNTKCIETFLYPCKKDFTKGAELLYLSMGTSDSRVSRLQTQNCLKG